VARIIVEAARPGEAFGLWRALAASQSKALSGSRIEIDIGGAEADRMIAQLLGQVEDFLTEQALDPVTLELNGDIHVVRPRSAGSSRRK
jgi:hypothetical protein